ncbi:MAG: molybdate ABC transporter permease subunit [Verrucomicrobiota bacterium]
MPSVPEIAASTVLWATLATTLVMVPGLPLAYLLARREFRGKRTLSTLVSMPLVLPPTAVGYLLLLLLSERGLLGREALGVDFNILLTWRAVVLACAVMAAPLVIRTARLAFEGVNPRLEVMARTLGYSPISTFLRITLPLASRGLLAAFILGFTRSLGEFGATVMIAGNIPGRTQTLASAIYSAQQSGDADRANLLLAFAIVVGFAAVFTTEWLTRRPARPCHG